MTAERIMASHAQVLYSGRSVFAPSRMPPKRLSAR